MVTTHSTDVTEAVKPILTISELKIARASLCQWQSPADFIAMVDELMSRMGGYQFFTDTKAAFGRDAWVAAKLASGLSGEAVRLGPDEWPDFEMRGEGPAVRNYRSRYSRPTTW